MFLLTGRTSQVSCCCLRMVRSLSATTTAQVDHYVVLGAKHDASAGELRTLFLNKCKECHPDKHQGDAAMHEKFVRIKQAYEVLSDPSRRKEYDYTLHKPFAARPAEQYREPNSCYGNSASSRDDVRKQRNRWNEEYYKARTSEPEQNRYSHPFGNESTRHDPLRDYWEYIYNKNRSCGNNSTRRRGAFAYRLLLATANFFIAFTLLGALLPSFVLCGLVTYVTFNLKSRKYTRSSGVQDK